MDQCIKKKVLHVYTIDTCSMFEVDSTNSSLDCVKVNIQKSKNIP